MPALTEQTMKGELAELDSGIARLHALARTARITGDADEAREYECEIAELSEQRDAFFKLNKASGKERFMLIQQYNEKHHYNRVAQA